jgi:hypothetical protein
MKRIARTAAPIIAAVALLAALSGSALAVSKTTPVPYQTTQPVPLALAGDQVAFKHIEPVPAPRI